MERVEGNVKSPSGAWKTEEIKIMHYRERLYMGDSSIDAHMWERFYEQLRRAKLHQAIMSSIRGSKKQLNELTLGDLIGKRKRAHNHANYPKAIVFPSKHARKNNSSQTTYTSPPPIPSTSEVSVIRTDVTVGDVVRSKVLQLKNQMSRELTNNMIPIERNAFIRQMHNDGSSINKLSDNSREDLFYRMNYFLEPSLLEFIDPSSCKGPAEQRNMMTDKEIEEELLTDPEASLSEIYKKRDVRMQIYAALGEAPPKGRPPRNEMDILKERVRRKFGANSSGIVG